MRSALLSAAVVLQTVLWAAPARPAAKPDRDYISIVGLPQVLQYTVAVATSIAGRTRQKFPLIEPMTTESGLRLFCGGLSDAKPDLFIVPTSPAGLSLETCRRNGAGKVIRLVIGRDALVVTVAGGQTTFNVSKRSLYLAMAENVPSTDDDSAGDKNPLATTFVANRFTRWKQIDPALPDKPIRLLTPPAQSVEWWSINDMIMRDGCRAVRPVAAMERVARSMFAQLCFLRRKDGAIVYADGQSFSDDPQVIPKEADDVALASYEMAGQDKDAKYLSVDDVLPSDDTINNQSYHLSRQVSVYVKTGRFNIVPGLRQFLVEMTSRPMADMGGSMAKIGLVPMPEVEQRENSVTARFGVP
jgi:phosphate transport system substrate-binding protein